MPIDRNDVAFLVIVVGLVLLVGLWLGWLGAQGEMWPVPDTGPSSVTVTLR